MNIALISEAGAGKDFTAELIIKQFGYTRYAFADHVKNVAKVWFPYLYDEVSKPRSLLQAIGTKFREIDADVWIKAMFEDIDENKSIAKKYSYTNELIVVTDCRMPNEYMALKERGFTFIRINADESIRQQRMKDRGDTFSKDDMKHHTESFYNSFECDYTVSNNGTIEELKVMLNDIMKHVENKEVV